MPFPLSGREGQRKIASGRSSHGHVDPKYEGSSGQSTMGIKPVVRSAARFVHDNVRFMRQRAASIE